MYFSYVLEQTYILQLDCLNYAMLISTHDIMVLEKYHLDTNFRTSRVKS